MASCVGRGRYLDLGIFSRRGAEWALASAPAEAWRLLVFSIWTDLFLFGETAESIASRIQDAVRIDAVNQRVA